MKEGTFSLFANLFVSALAGFGIGFIYLSYLLVFDITWRSAVSGIVAGICGVLIFFILIAKDSLTNHDKKQEEE